MLTHPKTVYHVKPFTVSSWVALGLAMPSSRLVIRNKICAPFPLTPTFRSNDIAN
jgi:hypothetical protein